VSALRYEDLLAAHLVGRQLPVRRGDVDGCVDALVAGASGRSLLASLVDRGALTMEQARHVHGEVLRIKRARARGVYAHLLRQELPAEEIDRCVQAAGPDASPDALGEAVRRRGLPEGREQQLRFQARLAFDRDVAETLRKYVSERRRAAAAGALGPEGAGLESLEASDEAIEPEEASRIVRASLSDDDESQPGPAFRIPDWVDMSIPLAGRQLGDYRVLGLVGAGAMGTVYLVDRSEEPDRPVALKVLPRDASADAQGRFKREILANGFFSSEHVVDIYDAGQTPEGLHYLAMEFVDGRDLEAVLGEGLLPLDRALDLARQVFAALRDAHRAGIVHRDVKPENVLVTRDGRRAKLMDFGVAVIRDLGDFEGQVFRSIEGSLTGTPEYMSPEQATGDAVTAKSDLYSMGCVLYRMLAGRLPFESETSRGWVTCHMLEEPLPLDEALPRGRSVPGELQALVERLLDKLPDERPADAGAVVEALDALLPRVRRSTSGGLFGLFRGR